MTTTDDQTPDPPDATPCRQIPPQAPSIDLAGAAEELVADADGFVEVLRDLDVLLSSATRWLDALPRGGDARERYAVECVTRLLVRASSDARTIVEAGERLAADVVEFAGRHSPSMQEADAPR